MSTLHDTAALGFSLQTRNYESVRPGYSAPVMKFAVAATRLQDGQGRRVLDLGAGTGKLTRQLLAYLPNAQLMAAEPVEAMRQEFERVIGPQVPLVDAAACSLPYEDSSLDAVFVGQAFHWFSDEESLREIHRVLKPGGCLCLIWNLEDDADPFVCALRAVYERHDAGIPQYRLGTWKEVFCGTWAAQSFTPVEPPVAVTDTSEATASPDDPARRVISSWFFHDESAWATAQQIWQRVLSKSYVAVLPQDEQQKLHDDIMAVVLQHATSFRPPGEGAVHAKEFVPSSATAPASSPAPSSPLVVGGIASSELVKAAPFVPQSAQSPVVAPGGKGKNVHSAPFVPRGHRRPASNQASTEDGTSTSQVPQHQHGGGRGGYTGRIMSPLKHGGGRGSGSAGSGGVPPPPYQGQRGGRGGSDGGGNAGVGPGGFGPRGRGMGRGSGMYSGQGSNSGAAGSPTAGFQSYSPGGTSSLPMQRPHEPYMSGPGRAMLQMRFVNEGLRQQLQQQGYLVQAQWSLETAGVRPEEFVPLPDKVQHYHTLYPLEEPAANGNDRMSSALGLRTFVFKAISSVDGQAYAIRRVCGKHVIPSSDLLSQAKAAVESWAPVSNHPNIAGLRAAFVSSEMDGGNALFFVHDYQPGSVTLAQAHLVPTTSASGVVALNTATEAQLWSYLVQLTAALRCVHGAGLVLRPGCLHPSKVLLSSTGHIQVSCVGMLDALNPGDLDQEDPVHMHRLELTAIGQLLLSLACAGIAPAPSLEACAAHYNMELTRIIAALLASSDGGQLASCRQLVVALADRTMAEFDHASTFGNNLMNELSKECENGRLLRLLVRLGFVNERPELEGDPQWAETGDRYLLKLFRDFVFHQTSKEGAPITDWGHVVEALNKLDAGVSEKILLMSRDEQSMLVVSYADLKRCVEGAFAHVQQARHRAQQPES